jgi:hypothetical protein
MEEKIKKCITNDNAEMNFKKEWIDENLEVQAMWKDVIQKEINCMKDLNV